MKERLTKEEYNSIPVYYCKLCLSLAILNIPDLEDSDFCNDCFSTDIGITNITLWEEMYRNKLNNKKSNYGREELRKESESRE